MGKRIQCEALGAYLRKADQEKYIGEGPTCKGCNCGGCVMIDFLFMLSLFGGAMLVIGLLAKINEQ